MDISLADGWELRNLGKINIVLGKNGCGKSTMLRAVDTHSTSIANAGRVTYITPERAGTLVYQAHVEQNNFGPGDQLRNNRRSNQQSEFKQQSVVQFRKLELLVAREVEKHLDSETEGKPATFGTYLRRVNALLDRVEVVPKDTAFVVVQKGSTTEVSPSSISSGESELITLGIEALVFEKEVESGKENILLLDEPDVHIHPDLQVRLMEFLCLLVNGKSARIILATHSTALFGTLRHHDGVSVAFMRSGDRELTFSPINEKHRRILPVFGAHPLSNIFNEAPALLVEGEDDERIFQQAVRSSRGRFQVYPCVCDNVQEMVEYEKSAKDIMNAVYDSARAFSLRDGDGNQGELDDDLPIVRLRLQCYAAENLLLTEEVLESLNSNWDSLKHAIAEWLKANLGHKHHPQMQAFADSGFDRRNHKIKDLRNDLMGLIGSAKPWEVAVGQVLGVLKRTDATDYEREGSIFTYLGRKTVVALIPV